mmetsp:Transcript_134746/g.430555  ORF Transcript_134746/g.430555 Transcript_134746/m.430555 type:complete len:148 (-) Transcript_134746:2203-2646(-)
MLRWSGSPQCSEDEVQQDHNSQASYTPHRLQACQQFRQRAQAPQGPQRGGQSYRSEGRSAQAARTPKKKPQDPLRKHNTMTAPCTMQPKQVPTSNLQPPPRNAQTPSYFLAYTMWLVIFVPIAWPCSLSVPGLNLDAGWLANSGGTI